MSALRVRPSHLIVAAVLAGCALGVALDRTAFAQQPAIKRTILGRIDVPTEPQYEGVIGISEIPAGGTSGKHRHPGIEIGYVLDGSLDLEYENGTKVTANTGQTFRNEGVHNGINRGTKPAKLLAVYAVEKGKPVTETVQ